jgi:predicted N-formylglutamate amidohydrolase
MPLDSVSRLRPSPQLIGAEDPAPFVVLNEDGAAPALVVCDHASRAFPRSMRRLGLPEFASWQHIAWDIGAGELARGLAAELDAPAILAGYSRLIVDCNRRPDDPEAFRTISDGWQIPGNLGLTEFDRRQRLASFFDPYHGAIEAALGGLRARQLPPAVISVHSFTPSMGGHERPWQIGILWDRDERMAEPMLEGLRRIDGLCVGDNEPYSGRHPSDFTIDHHAEAAGLPHVCIEVRQDQLESPAGVERWVRILSRLMGDQLGSSKLHRPFGATDPRSRPTAYGRQG